MTSEQLYDEPAPLPIVKSASIVPISGPINSGGVNCLKPVARTKIDGLIRGSGIVVEAVVVLVVVVVVTVIVVVTLI